MSVAACSTVFWLFAEFIDVAVEHLLHMIDWVYENFSKSSLKSLCK